MFHSYQYLLVKDLFHPQWVNITKVIFDLGILGLVISHHSYYCPILSDRVWKKIPDCLGPKWWVMLKINPVCPTIQARLRQLEKEEEDVDDCCRCSTESRWQFVAQICQRCWPFLNWTMAKHSTGWCQILTDSLEIWETPPIVAEVDASFSARKNIAIFQQGTPCFMIRAWFFYSLEPRSRVFGLELHFS